MWHDKQRSINYDKDGGQITALKQRTVSFVDVRITTQMSAQVLQSKHQGISSCSFLMLDLKSQKTLISLVL